MFKIALRNLLQEKTKLVISVGGVAFSVVLMMIVNLPQSATPCLDSSC